MSDNVVKLKPEETLPNEADPEIVAKLEELLELAKSGELRAIAYATVRPNNMLGTGWIGTAGTRYPVAGAVGMLHTRYFGALISDGSPVE